jgi:hypothetical protein
MPIIGLQDVTKKEKGADGSANEPSRDEQQRHLLKELKAILIACADPKQVTDQELQILMRTDFGQSIGPLTRAAFPPQVTSVLQHPSPAPVQYRCQLTEDEMKAVKDAPDVLLPAPAHDYRDKFVTCMEGGEHFAILNQINISNLSDPTLQRVIGSRTPGHTLKTLAGRLEEEGVVSVAAQDTNQTATRHFGREEIPRNFCVPHS